MEELIKIYQDYLDMDEEERNSIAIQTIDTIFEHLKEFYDDDTILKRIVDMFSVICSADGVISEEEYDMFSLLTKASVTFEQFSQVMQYGQYEEIINNFFEFANSQSDDFIGSLFFLTLCVFSCKGTITPEEQEFVYNKFIL